MRRSRSAAKFRVGVQLHPQHATIEQLRDAWRATDRLGVDSIWIWDHFFPLYDNRNGWHFEGWSLLAAMAVDTSHAEVGVLVTCNSYRNPDLLADMARTVDHLSGGRVILGIGAGWFERDYREYGYEFGTVGSRLQALEQSLPRIRARLNKLNPGPKGRLPILIGGSGVRITLRLVAQHADLWNSFGVSAEEYRRLNAVLDDWCHKVGRNSAEIERTVSVNQSVRPDEYLEAGAQHIILECGMPYDLRPTERLLGVARG